MEKALGIDSQLWDKLFPFNFVLDAQLTIIHTGKSLKKLLPHILQCAFDQCFDFKRPYLTISNNYESILSCSDQVFIIESKHYKGLPLRMRGQFIEINHCLFFAGSPWITSVDHLEIFGLSITDFALNDPVTDLLQLLKVQQLTNQDYERQRDQLIKTNKQIDELAKLPSESPNPILRVSFDGRIQYANRAAEPMLQLWSVTIGDICPDAILQTIESVVHQNEELEFEIQTADQWYSFQFIPVAQHGYVNIYGKDISLIKETENILKQSEERFKLLVEDANDIIYRTNAEGYFVYINPIVERIFKVRIEDVTSKHFTEFVRQDWRPRAIEFYKEQFLKRIASTYYEFPAINFNGEEIWIGQNVKLLKQGKMVTGFQAVARDITPQVEMKQSLREAKIKAEESLKTKESFLANMSHEIRTPMNGILGMSHLLSTANLSEKYQGYLNSIKTSAANLLVIINDILDFSKIESGKLELENIAFRLGDTIDRSFQSVEYLAIEKDLYLTKEIHPEDANEILIGDPTRLIQVLINLLSNAIKFTAQGEVKLTTKVDDGPDDKVLLSISVQDTGIGIPNEKLKSIFDSFSQADTSTARKFGGTGLGLSICKSLVEMQGGSIGVDSKLNKGSNFYFEIPFAVGKEEDLAAPEMMPQEFNLEKTRLLLVEDHKINQIYAISILEEHHIQVDLAEDGLAAIEKLRTNVYDIVLMDMQMPVMGGIEATTIIRNELGLTVPIIALTANAIKGDSEKCLQAGMDDYISKPFNVADLISKIVRWVRKAEEA